MNFVDLLLSCIFASSDGPDRLIGKDNVLPIGNVLLDGVELFFNDFHSLIGFSLLQCFPEAINDFQPNFESIFNFFCQEFIGLLEMLPSFRVPNDDPFKIHVLDVLCCNLPSVGSIAVRGAVLSCNLNMLVLFGEHDGHKVKVNGSYHNIYIDSKVPTCSGSNSSLSIRELTKPWLWARVLLLFQLPPKNSFRIALYYQLKSYHSIQPLSAIIALILKTFPRSHLLYSSNVVSEAFCLIYWRLSFCSFFHGRPSILSGFLFEWISYNDVSWSSGCHKGTQDR